MSQLTDAATNVKAQIAAAEADVANAKAALTADATTLRAKVVAYLKNPVVTAAAGAVAGKFGPQVLLAVLKHVF